MKKVNRDLNGNNFCYDLNVWMYWESFKFVGCYLLFFD